MEYRFMDFAVSRSRHEFRRAPAFGKIQLSRIISL
jgi:hypothetical protein